jgi:hypothetical protein
MSISVQCDECGKTYQVRDDMAGRRGKCPRGHSITVPAAPGSAGEENAFAFTPNPMAADADDAPPTPKSSRRRPARPEPEPAPAVDDNDFSAFPTKVAGSSVHDEEAPAPMTGRHRRPERKAAVKEGKPNLMPLILGGILAVLGIGGGVTLLVVSRGEAGPLKDRAEQADKKAAAAEERAQKAEGLKLVAEAELDKLKKSPPKDPALAETQKQLKAAEKRATDAERKLTEQAKGRDPLGAEAAMPAKDLDPSSPGGKNDPVMPGGKLETDRPKGKEMEKKEMDKPGAKKDTPANPPAENLDGPPLGGKNWTSSGAAKFGDKNLKGGDLIWLWPLEDVAPKVENGKLTIKFRWQLRKGKQLPKTVGFGMLIQEAKQTRLMAAERPLTGEGGEAEATFNVTDFKGGLPVSFYVGNGQTKDPIAHSNMLGFQVNFGPAK